MSDRSPSVRSGSVRVITLNLWVQNGVWEEPGPVLIDGLRQLNPDLVAFQKAIRTDDYDQAVDLLRLDYYVV